MVIPAGGRGPRSPEIWRRTNKAKQTRETDLPTPTDGGTVVQQLSTLSPFNFLANDRPDRSYARGWKSLLGAVTSDGGTFAGAPPVAERAARTLFCLRAFSPLKSLLTSLMPPMLSGSRSTKLVNATVMDGPNKTNVFLLLSSLFLVHNADRTYAVDKKAHSFTLPSNLASGGYLLRHEIIALHLADQPGGATFYPACVQLEVGGNQSGVPSPDEFAQFPGAYYADSDPVSSSTPSPTLPMTSPVSLFLSSWVLVVGPTAVPTKTLIPLRPLRRHP